jgi:hypothetical protein
MRLVAHSLTHEKAAIDEVRFDLQLETCSVERLFRGCLWPDADQKLLHAPNENLYIHMVLRLESLK